MSKNFAKSAEDRSLFLINTSADDDGCRKGERADTRPFRAARMIDIKRIQPDPNQPRKTFNQVTLASLAESIKELGGIIDPLTVEYVEDDDIFRIISGERRYRAAIMAGLEKLPCIIKEVDDEKRFLLQFIANLQREDITPLEEAAGIRHLVEKYGYTQQKIARLFNKSKSYISQILGLERLTPPAKEIVQTSELSKEALIQASREKEPEKQVKILKKASIEGQTVKQIRGDLIKGNSSSNEDIHKNPDNSSNSFIKWTWTSENNGFIITVKFKIKQNETEKTQLIRSALKETNKHISDATDET